MYFKRTDERTKEDVYDDNWGGEDLNNTDISTESKISLEIKIMAEVEKIWINYDEDGNGDLDFEEI